MQDIGRFGSLQFSDNYTNMLKHEVQVQPGEDFQDLLGNPTSIWNYESYAKARSDTSTTWSPSGGIATLQANYGSFLRPSDEHRSWTDDETPICAKWPIPPRSASRHQVVAGRSQLILNDCICCTFSQLRSAPSTIL
ncbi:MULTISPECIES: hypothetical protein [Stenotrophomonas]|uniref:hypothetical protein n=1 Tax=Stenotrophomonas TaxID=40323 RepID=UPI001E493D03|nr:MULTISPECIES: hypothetical protein [Stenotrophomonas]MDQ4679760.1 hypothetical protein [Stenotrophomonas maltophilia group sp. RNC7]UGB20571.1 hypothetical protein LQ335_15160 [Stenotrophomonas maltophilia]